MVPMFSGRDVSKPGDPDSVTASGSALEGDYDVCVATHEYGEGCIAYFGDVNCESRTVELVASFVGKKSKAEPVGLPAWLVDSKLHLPPDAYREAMTAKAAGNAAFGRGEAGFNEAIEHYEEALASYGDKKGMGIQREEKVKIWSNLAECHLRREEWSDAAVSASEALFFWMRSILNCC